MIRDLTQIKELLKLCRSNQNELNRISLVNDR
jgi:hypothetical protein